MSALELRMPDLADVTHRMVQVHEHGDALALHVAEAGAGVPVLLLHGSPQHWWEYRRVIPELAADHRVIAADLRGAGWSDAPDHGYDEAQQTADVLALLDALGIERVHLVVHDYSAFLGWRLAFDHPDRLASLTALGSPHPWSGITPKMALQLWRAWFQQVIISPFGPRLIAGGRQRLVRYMIEGYAPGLGGCDVDDLECFLAPLRDPVRARALARTYRSLVLPGMMTMAALGRGRRLTVPTRILLGARDPIMRAARTDDVGDRADDLVAIWVEDAAHYIASERPDAVVAAVRELTR
ncbi:MULTISPECIES: alpha/beta fold hydrolase [unclassified Microbacterium]|uniref:alpha/beta fold hydrolase n=1 Tax=Microbacterium TaxID=33882 RepID=UPI003BA3208C